MTRQEAAHLEADPEDADPEDADQQDSERQQRHDRFARSDIALQQPQHALG